MDGLDTRRIRDSARYCAFNLFGKLSNFVNIYEFYFSLFSLFT